MKHIFLLLSTFFLFGCVGPKTRLQAPMNSIGLVVHNDSKMICHRHIGFTVFGNYVTPYDLQTAYSALLVEELRKAYSGNNTNVALISPSDVEGLGNPSVERSTWDNSGKILPQSVDAYVRLAEDRGLDAVMVVTGEPITGQHGCAGIVNFTSGAKGSGVYPPIVHVFAPNGDWAGNIYTYDNEGFPQPAGDKVLSDEFLAFLEQRLRSGVAGGVDRFTAESSAPRN